MFLPPLSQLIRFEKSLPAQTRFAQEALAPDAQWAAQPFGNRRRKTFLGPLHESRRDIMMQDSPQQPFALISSLFHRSGQAPSEFNHSMIQKRNTGFQADRHGGPVHFHEDV